VVYLIKKHMPQKDFLLQLRNSYYTFILIKLQVLSIFSPAGQPFWCRVLNC
jgi:hypothetical protein